MTFEARRKYPYYTVMLLAVFLGFSVPAAEMQGESLFSSGQRFYEAGEFENARDAFLQALETGPEISRYHHWLGKAYGRLAENAGILQAYSLSKKVRRHLERAVELDNRNIPALTDLMEFYRRAPGFLGGGSEKAGAVCRRIQKLRQEGAMEQPAAPPGDDTPVPVNDREKC